MRNFENNKSKYVVVYGCCSHMGKLASNIMIKYGYSVILVDTNLEKLQKLKYQLIRTYMDQFGKNTKEDNKYDDRIKLL